MRSPARRPSHAVQFWAGEEPAPLAYSPFVGDNDAAVDFAAHGGLSATIPGRETLGLSPRGKPLELGTAEAFDLAFAFGPGSVHFGPFADGNSIMIPSRHDVICSQAYTMRE